MAVSDHSPTLRDALAPADERRILYDIIRTVSASVELKTVLQAVVRLIVEGAKAQSCFIWIVEPDDTLVLRAASGGYAAMVGRARLRAGEGFAGWVVAHREPIFLPDDALADPRARYFPEFDEERYQSMVSVPLVGRDGAVFGVIGIHSVAPRVLGEDDARFVIHSATLVAGAIANARLYEAATRRVRDLEWMADISDRAARAATPDELLPAVAEAGVELLDADQVVVYVTDRDGRLVRRAAAPNAAGTPPVLARSVESRITRAVFPTAAATLQAPMAADGERLGVAVARRDRPFTPDAQERALTIAAQAAVGLKKIQLIDRLTEKNLIRDFFADLVAGRSETLATRARRLGVDLSTPRLAVMVVPWQPARRSDTERIAAIERFEADAARLLPGVVFDRRDDHTQGLVGVLGTGDEESLVRLRRALGGLALIVGVSNRAVGAPAVATALREATETAHAAPVLINQPAVLRFDDLGPYRYLLRIRDADPQRDHRRQAINRLAAYDQRRHTRLVATLEEYLARRGNTTATAQALYVHPNTLRQRLRRLQDVSGLDLAGEEWLALEIVLKLARLERALEAS